MNLAFYFSHDIVPNLGGTERVTHVIANYLHKCDINYLYIAFKPKRNPTFDDVHQYYLPNSNVLTCEENINFVNELIKEKQIDILINQDSFDVDSEFCTQRNFPSVKCITVIHYNLFGSCVYIEDAIKGQYIIGKTPIIKYLVQKLIMPYYKHKAYKQRTAALQKIYSSSNHVVVLSQSDKDEYPVNDKSRIHVISNPVTLPQSSADSKKENRTLYVGRMVFSQKRVDLLLKAWKIVEKKHPDWHLDLLGDGNSLDYYKGLASTLRLQNANFHGNQPPSEYYKRASIFCLTSTFEGFGLVLAEAMNEGTVPVAFNSFGAAKDIIDNNINGILVHPFSIKEYASAINRLIENEEQLKEMSEAAKIKVHDFDVDKIGQKWIKFLYSI